MNQYVHHGSVIDTAQTALLNLYAQIVYCAFHTLGRVRHLDSECGFCDATLLEHLLHSCDCSVVGFHSSHISVILKGE